MAEDVMYNHQVIGFGKTQESSLKDAEKKLDFRVEYHNNYCSLFKQEDPENVEGGKYKTIIRYSLKTDDEAARKVTEEARARPSSAGPVNDFSSTRDLTHLL